MFHAGIKLALHRYTSGLVLAQYSAAIIGWADSALGEACQRLKILAPPPSIAEHALMQSGTSLHYQASPREHWRDSGTGNLMNPGEASMMLRELQAFRFYECTSVIDSRNLNCSDRNRPANCLNGGHQNGSQIADFQDTKLPSDLD